MSSGPLYFFSSLPFFSAPALSALCFFIPATAWQVVVVTAFSCYCERRRRGKVRVPGEPSPESLPPLFLFPSSSPFCCRWIAQLKRRRRWDQLTWLFTVISKEKERRGRRGKRKKKTEREMEKEDTIEEGSCFLFTSSLTLAAGGKKGRSVFASPFRANFMLC